MSYSEVTAAEIQPNKPGRYSLFNKIRDNFIAIYSLLTTHTHDGVDTPVIDVGADTLRNSSFETGDLTNWDDTAYTGGSIAVATTGAMDGNYAAGITSTVPANGGGYITTEQFIPVSGGETKQFRLMVKASTSGVSSKAEVIWYQGDQSTSDGTVTIYTTASTPTSSRLCVRRLVAPETTRYCKIRLTGGIPASGGAGTVYFDGIAIQPPAMLGGQQIFTASGTFSSVIGDISIEAMAGTSESINKGGYSRLNTSINGDLTVTIFGYEASVSGVSVDGGQNTGAASGGDLNLNRGSMATDPVVIIRW